MQRRVRVLLAHALLAVVVAADSTAGSAAEGAGRCDVVLQSHLNAGVIAVRKSCWAMRFIDYWVACRSRIGKCSPCCHCGPARTSQMDI